MSFEPVKGLQETEWASKVSSTSQNKEEKSKIEIDFKKNESSAKPENYPGLGVEKSDEKSPIDKIAQRELIDLNQLIDSKERKLSRAEYKLSKGNSRTYSVYGYKKMQEELAALKADRDDLAQGKNVEEILNKYAPKTMERLARKESRPIRAELNKVESQIKRKSAELYRTRDYGEGSDSEKLKSELQELYSRKDQLLAELNPNHEVKTAEKNEKVSANNNQVKYQSKADPKDVKNICDDMYKAIDGFGTDDELFEKTLSRLNKDNIIEVMDQWEKSYGKDYQESFMDSFLGDADKTQQSKYGKEILDLLQQRAKANGLDVTEMTSSLKMELEQGLSPHGNKKANFIAYNVSQLFGEIKEKEQ